MRSLVRVLCAEDNKIVKGGLLLLIALAERGQIETGLGKYVLDIHGVLFRISIYVLQCSHQL